MHRYDGCHEWILNGIPNRLSENFNYNSISEQVSKIDTVGSTGV